MLSENIKSLRKSKGMTQDELAAELNVVRQTVSKWEKGLSVPDSDMLMSLSEVLEAPVSCLLGETIAEPETELKEISSRLEAIDLQIAKRREAWRRAAHWMLIALCAVTIVIFAALVIIKSPYQSWDYSDPETAVFGAAFHVFEYLFVRSAPFVILGAAVGIILTRRKA